MGSLTLVQSPMPGGASLCEQQGHELEVCLLKQQPWLPDCPMDSSFALFSPPQGGLHSPYSHCYDGTYSFQAAVLAMSLSLITGGAETTHLGEAEPHACCKDL